MCALNTTYVSRSAGSLPRSSATTFGGRAIELFCSTRTVTVLFATGTRPLPPEISRSSSFMPCAKIERAASWRSPTIVIGTGGDSAACAVSAANASVMRTSAAR